MNTEERVKLIEEAMLLMKSLLVRHEERLDDFDEKFQKSREDFDFKMNAVINSQIKTESEMIILKESTSKLEKSTSKLEKSTSKLEKSTSNLEESTSRLEESISKLATSTSNLKDASRSQLKRIERLEQI